MLSTTMILVLVGLGAFCFLGYVAYQIKTTGSSPKSPEQTSDDHKLIEKTKEMNLIHSVKKLQQLSSKNKLFERSFVNVYGGKPLQELGYDEQAALDSFRSIEIFDKDESEDLKKKLFSLEKPREELLSFDSNEVQKPKPKIDEPFDEEQEMYFNSISGSLKSLYKRH